MISPLDVPADDDEHDAWLRQGPFAGKPFRDFIPPGELHSIGLMIDNPALNWPWPYTYEQLKNALVILPQAVRDECGRQLVRNVRIYLAKRWVKIKEPRGNSGEALRKAIQAGIAFLRAIGDLNVMDADDLRRRYMMDCYVHERATIEGIYDAAFGGVRPKRRFPSFAWAIFEPLKAWGVDPHADADTLGRAIKELRRPPDRKSRGTVG